METIIGLGSAGCNIAEKFMQYPQYDVYRIDSEKRKGPKFKKLVERETHEEYEQKCPSLKAFFKNAKPPYLFILGGSGTISGASLRILEQLKSNDIYVLYVKSDTSLMSHTRQMQDKVVFQVMQQFARSAMLKRLFVVDNTNLEEVCQDASVMNYHDKLNELLASTVHMYNIFRNTKSVVDTFSSPIETARISTFSIVDYETGEEKPFYDLQIPREKVFFYSIPKDTLEKETGLLKKIKEQVKNKLDENLKVSYGIYPNQYDSNYIYSVWHSTLIQEQALD